MTKRKSKSAVRRGQSLAAQVRDLRLLVESRLQPVPAPAPEPIVEPELVELIEPEPVAPEPTKVETAPKAAPEPAKREGIAGYVVAAAILLTGLVAAALILISRTSPVPQAAAPAVNAQAEAEIASLKAENAELKAAQPMTVVVQGPTVVQTETVAIPVGVAGVSELTLTEYMSDTTDVGALIAVLDRDWESSYDLGHRGEWSGGGTVVECTALLWTDFHGSPPSTVEDVRREGGWGVYRVPEGWETPQKTAGRWICLAP